MIRRADPADAPAIAAFLQRHLESSMFLLGNLDAHGIGETLHPNGTRFLLREGQGGITGVFGWTNGGYLMTQVPAMTPLEAEHFAAALGGYAMRGLTGAADQVGCLQGALPIQPDAWTLNRDEPLMARSLYTLPMTAVTLRRPEPVDRALLERWFAGYIAETGLSAGGGVRLKAVARAQSAIAGDSVRLMIHAGEPVAMCAINARAGDAVQIGGVFVPPEHRGRGYAGQLVLSHLKELREDGVRRASLFAASKSAERAYARVGFTRIGSYRVALLGRPVILRMAA